MATLDPVSAALADSAVRAAVVRAVDDSLEGRREAEAAFWGGTSAEVRRLREVVRDQAARIASLEAKISALETELSQVELAELMAGVAASIANADLALEGYAINTARVEVKAAVQLAGERMLVTADPGALLAPESLSTLAMTLGALPPPAGSGG
jgi:hypothetical protein